VSFGPRDGDVKQASLFPQFEVLLGWRQLRIDGWNRSSNASRNYHQLSSQSLCLMKAHYPDDVASESGNSG